MIKRPLRIFLAILLIIFLYFIWIGIGSALFGWRHGGGAIPMMLFLALAAFVWRTITKKTPEEKRKALTQNSDTDSKTEDADK
ncbi:NfeD family protein [Treponema endosymbiont of Eucomonympha sp.]|uniref:NfeD family protein n=1 Tax=Treponema endosymbiont of Eucomonympha sp. TaxID=1580831 RepID=UPI001396B119|nr:hypothetical protein [Treponema endosymbiont of Eucomonympha sp.]